MGLETIKTRLTKDLILSVVSELDIFEEFCPTRFSLNKPFSSPFRRDSSPSCVIHWKNGYYYFVDYGDSNYRGDAFDFVKFLTNASTFMDTLEYVNTRMNLKLTTTAPKVVSERKKIEIERVDEPVVDEAKIIQAKVKRFGEDEVKYWNRYYLSINDLKRHKDVQVYCIDRFWINKKLFYINHNDICFGYFFNEKYWKLYRPYADVKNGEWKWISNVPLKHMYGLGNLKKGTTGIGAKSVKDFLVLSKIKDEICGTQNESLAAISEENAAYITDNCDEFYLWMDNDAPGKKASFEVTGTYNYKHVNNPDFLLKFGCKDPSDWAERDTPEAIEYHLKCKSIL